MMNQWVVSKFLFLSFLFLLPVFFSIHPIHLIQMSHAVGDNPPTCPDLSGTFQLTRMKVLEREDGPTRAGPLIFTVTQNGCTGLKIKTSPESFYARSIVADSRTPHPSVMSAFSYIYNFTPNALIGIMPGPVQENGDAPTLELGSIVIELDESNGLHIVETMGNSKESASIPFIEISTVRIEAN